MYGVPVVFTRRIPPDSNNWSGISFDRNSDRKTSGRGGGMLVDRALPSPSAFALYNAEMSRRKAASPISAHIDRNERAPRNSEWQTSPDPHLYTTARERAKAAWHRHEPPPTASCASSVRSRRPSSSSGMLGYNTGDSTTRSHKATTTTQGEFANYQHTARAAASTNDGVAIYLVAVHQPRVRSHECRPRPRQSPVP